MERIGIRKAKNHLSEYLRRVRAGERVMITDRGEPVALLVPLEVAGDEAAAWSLVEQGMAAWSGGKPTGAREPSRVAEQRAAAVVIEDRR